MSRAPARIVLAIGSLEIGGAERQILEVCRRLPPQEFEFHVVSAAAGGALEQEIRQTGARVHTLLPGSPAESPGRLRRGRRFLRTVLRLRRLFKSIRPSLIHAYLFEMSVAVTAARWPRKSPPLLLSRRSLVKWIARDELYFPLARWTDRHADRMLANSEAVRQDALAKENVAPERIEVIYNGVDTELYAPRPADESLKSELGLRPGVAVVGMVANHHRYKGHAEVLGAAEQAVARGRDLMLLFVGREGPASESLRWIVREHGLSKRVIFTGPRADVPRVLNLMDVFVSASHEEGFSNSILEAMACGRAIVATAVGGTVEQIEDEASGLLVPAEDSAALGRALGRLLENPDLATRLGRAARDRAVARFSIDRLCARMAELYREIALRTSQ